MEKWEYTSTTVTWNEKAKKWESIGPAPANTAVKSEYFYAALEPYGEQGWEAVGFAVTQYLPGSFSVGIGSFVTEWNAMMFRVMFKRRKP